MIELYSAPDSPVSDLAAFLRDLRRIRRQGFAVNNQGTEAAVTAIGKAIASPGDVAPSAVSIAMPTARYRRERLAEWARDLGATVVRIERDLAGAG